MTKTTLSQLLSGHKIIPVVTINQVENAVPLAQTFLQAGISVIEVTLRTAAALAAIEQIKQSCPEMLIGAGTVINKNQLTALQNIGVDFIVSPGCSADLIQAAHALNLPILPGVATATEVILASDLGCQQLKLFPAEIVGGCALLKQYASVFPQLQFCPTGGVHPSNLQSYLACPNVFAVGGSWLSPRDLLAQKDWGSIAELVAQTLSNLSGKL